MSLFKTPHAIEFVVLLVTVIVGVGVVGVTVVIRCLFGPASEIDLPVV